MGAPAQELLFAGERLVKAVKARAGVDWTLAGTASGDPGEIGAELCLAQPMQSPEAYELSISDKGVQIDGGSPHGVFNAVCTLIQIVEQSAGRLPFLSISDAPDFPNRGVMLDISRDKVPTMSTLLDLVDMLASWKVNQLQLYTEHTFTYRNHPAVWEHASPMSEQEIMELDRFCRVRFIELVPNQNSFGHMDRWLKHPRYRDLAECPEEAAAHWWGQGPFSLNPTDPRGLALLRELYDELLPNFSSRQFNVGCDETFDLGEGRSREACEARGAGRVYLEYLHKLHDEVRGRGLTMMFWGDIIVQHPELITELPKEAIALDWGYEADYTFEENAEAFAAAGIPFYVCPGTSSWNSLAGRTDNAIGNIQNAALSGLKHGAIGLLNTDWGDRGHWQYLPASFLGLAYGAAMAWSVQANQDLDLPNALDLHAFKDKAGIMGRLAYDLGNVYRIPGIEPHNESLLFTILQAPLAQTREIGGLTRDALDKTLDALDRSIEPLEQARMHRSDAELIRLEFENAVRLLRHGAQRGLLALGSDREPSSQIKRLLDADIRQIMRAHGDLWLARNRPGGLQDSLARMERVRDAYAV